MAPQNETIAAVRLGGKIPASWAEIVKLSLLRFFGGFLCAG
jgi:hypothetical protein